MKEANGFHLRKTPTDRGEVWQIAGPNEELVEQANRFLHTLGLRGLSPRTGRTYAYDLLCACRWLHGEVLPPAQIIGEHLLEFVEYQRQTLGSSATTINRRLRLLQRFVEFLTGAIPTITAWKKHHNPVFRSRSRRGVIRVQEAKTVIHPLSDTEVRRFYSSLNGWRDRAIMLLMWAAGLRSMEVINLQLTDIDLQRNSLRLLGKGSKERVMPICESIAASLRKYETYERPEDSEEQAFFLILKGPTRGQPMNPEALRYIFRYHRQRSGVARANPHRFRHSFGANMNRKGTPLLVLARMMGHSSPQTTMGYVKVEDQEVRAHYLQALENINPGDLLDEKTET
ncbi:MAG: tyrosine-type recombinase/integrase [Verrucomicrobiota bacterium]